MNTHVDLSPSWQGKVWENKRHGTGKRHGAGKKAWRWKKRAWRWEKGGWRGTILKGAGGNTSYFPSTYIISPIVTKVLVLSNLHISGCELKDNYYISFILLFKTIFTTISAFQWFLSPNGGFLSLVCVTQFT